MSKGRGKLQHSQYIMMFMKYQIHCFKIWAVFLMFCLSANHVFGVSIQLNELAHSLPSLQPALLQYNRAAPKTQEMVIDFRKFQHDPPTLSINGEVVERVDSYSYVDISNQLYWSLKTKRIQIKVVSGTTFVQEM